MTPAGPLFHKPKSFIAAKNLLYASICVGILAALLNYFTVDAANNGGVLALMLTAAGYVILFFIIKQMSLCKKWARTTLLILFILVTILYIGAFKLELHMSMLEGALIVIQACLQIIALIFLYTKESNNWFNSSTAAMLP
ncbi:MAG: hypothetical protein ACR2FN_04255 [Chitinophagaceae bacterium]